MNMKFIKIFQINIFKVADMKFVLVSQLNLFHFEEQIFRRVF